MKIIATTKTAYGTYNVIRVSVDGELVKTNGKIDRRLRFGLIKDSINIVLGVVASTARLAKISNEN